MTRQPSPSRAEQDGREGLEQALRALRHRDRSTSQVDRYLAERGVESDERVEILQTLARTSLVDDRRFAETRASSLAERGAGDARIRHELVHAGLDRDLIDDVLEALPAELERAERIVARRGSSPKTLRYLAGKGFSEEVVRAVVARSQDEPLG
jgi:regulatory protein